MRDRLQEGLNQLRAFFHNQPLHREFDAELAAHLELAIKENLRAASLFGNFIDRLMGDVSKSQDDTLSVTFNVTLFAFLTASDTGA